MNGKERMALAMRHKQGDRVPVMCQLAIGHYFLNTEIEPYKIWFTSQGFADALVEVQKRYRFDGILINIWGMPDSLLDYAQSIEKENEDTIITWQNGEITIIPPADNANHYKAGRKPLDRADFDNLNLDDLDSINNINGYFWNIYHMPNIPEVTKNFTPGETPEYLFNTIKKVKSQVGNETSVHGELYSPFTHYVELLGYEEALMSLLIDPEKAHKIMKYMTELTVKQALNIGNQDVDAVLISSAFAGGPFLSREMYSEFVVPYEKQITDAVKSTGKPVYTHTCGSIGDRLDLMVNTGTMGIDTLDPPPLGNSDLKTALTELDHRVFVKGNMNAVKILELKSKDEVIEHASNRIKIGKPYGAYILSTACSVSPRTEPWKLELLVPLSEEIGKYD